jgi:hypothetical protein
VIPDLQHNVFLVEAVHNVQYVDSRGYLAWRLDAPPWVSRLVPRLGGHPRLRHGEPAGGPMTDRMRRKPGRRRAPDQATEFRERHAGPNTARRTA